ncbi:MAG: shikimate kinase [Proteobacteria bacterium]|nr:shikimate kinase [Pseudomonadota bacterium]
MNIVLIGFMGTGKTTIGRKLAVRLGYRFIDTDQYIEREQQCRIPEIFASRGEKCFRDLETSLLKRLSKVDNTVVATGGGILVTPGNKELIRQIGKTIHLKAHLDDIYERVMRNTKRPLVQTENPLKTVTELYERRKNLYHGADITIDTKSLKMWTIVTKIICGLCEAE